MDIDGVYTPISPERSFHDPNFRTGDRVIASGARHDTRAVVEDEQKKFTIGARCGAMESEKDDNFTTGARCGANRTKAGEGMQRDAHENYSADAWVTDRRSTRGGRDGNSRAPRYHGDTDSDPEVIIRPQGDRLTKSLMLYPQRWTERYSDQESEESDQSAESDQSLHYSFLHYKGNARVDRRQTGGDISLIDVGIAREVEEKLPAPLCGYPGAKRELQAARATSNCPPRSLIKQPTHNKLSYDSLQRRRRSEVVTGYASTVDSATDMEEIDTPAVVRASTRRKIDGEFALRQTCARQEARVDRRRSTIEDGRENGRDKGTTRTSAVDRRVVNGARARMSAVEAKPSKSTQRKKDYIKLDRFDGTGALETFLIQLATCAEYNEWSEAEKLAQLKAALRGPAAQVLLSEDGPQTFDSLCSELRDNFGTKGFETQFESQLRVRRRRKGESLRELFQDINRLVLLAYPDSKGRLRDKLAMESFVDGLNDADLALKVRNLSPTDLQSAYRTALMLESNQMLVNRGEEASRKRRDERVDIQARAAVTFKEDQLLERIKRLEEQLAATKLPPPKSWEYEDKSATRVQEQAERMEKIIVELEGRLTALQGNRQRTNEAAPTNSRSGDVAERQGPTVEGKKGVFPRATTCYTCGEPGHRSPDCPFSKSFAPQRGSGRQSQGGERIIDRSVGRPRTEQGKCFGCGESGHFRRDCPKQGDAEKRQDKDGFAAMKLACGDKAPEMNPHVYLEMTLDRVKRSFLIDSGCDLTILPLRYVGNRVLHDTARKVYAANGAEIAIRGEVTVDLWLGNMAITTDALVSEFVAEAMIGYDWLSMNDCYWGFRVGQIMVRDQVFPLQSRTTTTRCCRVMVEEAVRIPPKSEAIVAGKLMIDRVSGREQPEVELATVPRETRGGLYIARVVVPHKCTAVPVRVLNSSSRAVTLQKGSLAAELESVEVLEVHDQEGTDQRSDPTEEWAADLLNGVEADIGAENREELRSTLEEYSDCFSRSDFDVGRTSLVKHRIDTGDSRPVRQALRRQPLTYLPEIDRQLAEMEEQGIIEPSASPWASNLVVVKKKDGSLRMCVDYRGVNNVTKKDSYPLPRIVDCLDALGSATYFSTFDLRSGYFQIGMDEDDQDKTSFLTRRGSFRFTSMPFGLCNAPATFQRLMDAVMMGLNYEICLVYLDDIICSPIR